MGRLGRADLPAYLDSWPALLPLRHARALRFDLGAQFANAVLQLGVRDLVAVLRGEPGDGFLIFVASADAQRLPFLRSELQSRIDALLIAPIANVELFAVVNESEGLERAAFAIMAIVVDLRSLFLIGEKRADVSRLGFDKAVALDLSGFRSSRACSLVAASARARMSRERRMRSSLTAPSGR